MSEKLFLTFTGLIGVAFAAVFCIVVVPPLAENWDVMGALLAGFVNPFAAGYSTDTLMCWAVLAVWVIYEARAHNIKHGWIALIIGAAPGVATGFALYLIMRHKQLNGQIKT